MDLSKKNRISPLVLGTPPQRDNRKKLGDSGGRPKETVFNTITSDDWRRSIADGRAHQNEVIHQFRSFELILNLRPMNAEEQARLAKLPKWAQDHISNLQTTLSNNLGTLKRIQNEKQVGPFIFPDSFFQEQGGPKPIHRRVNAPIAYVEHGGLRLTIILREEDGANGKPSVEIQFSSATSNAPAVIVPSASNSISIQSLVHFRSI